MDNYLVNLDAGIEYQFDIFSTGIDATKLGIPSIQIKYFDTFLKILNLQYMMKTLRYH